MEYAQMGLYGANMNTQRADIICAVLEGLAFSEVQALLPMTKLAPVQNLTLTGGGASNALWAQIFADLLGVPVQIPDVADAACRGAAMLAGVGGRLLNGFGSLSTPPIGRVYLPNSEASTQTREAFDLWMTYFSHMKPLWSSEINEKL